MKGIAVVMNDELIPSHVEYYLSRLGEKVQDWSVENRMCRAREAVEVAEWALQQAADELRECSSFALEMADAEYEELRTQIRDAHALVCTIVD